MPMADADPTSLWRFAHLGLEFAGALIVMAFLGWLVDGQLGTTPWGMLVGGLLGLAGGMYLFVQQARVALKQSSTAEPQEHPEKREQTRP